MKKEKNKYSEKYCRKKYTIASPKIAFENYRRVVFL